MYINIRIGIPLGFLKLHFNQLNLKKKPFQRAIATLFNDYINISLAFDGIL